MRSSTWVVMAGLAVAGLLGCGSEQPELYRIALDVDPLATLPGTCYRDGNTPPSGNRNDGIMLPTQWILWKGFDGARYLEPGNLSVQLGDAGQAELNGLGLEGRVGEDKVFGSELVRNFGDATLTQRIVITFAELGAEAKGTMELSLACTSIPGSLPCPPNCSATLPFSGRRLDVDADALYLVGN
jgi:hypothetical protein